MLMNYVSQKLDTVKRASSCVRSLWHHTGVSRRDRRTDRNAIANTARSIAAHCKNRLRTYREILPEDRQRDKQTRRTFSRASLRICFQLGQWKGWYRTPSITSHLHHDSRAIGRAATWLTRPRQTVSTTSPASSAKGRSAKSPTFLCAEYIERNL